MFSRNHPALRALAFVAGNRDDAGRVLERVDWNRLARLAGTNRLMPALAEASETYSSTFPKSLSEMLRRRKQRLATLNLGKGATLVKVCRAFRDAEIDFLAYKGCLLAEQFYGGVGNRQFVDIDLLVRENDLQKAVQCLKGLGFEGDIPDDNQWRPFIDWECEFDWVDPASNIHLELHWRVLPRRHNTPLSTSMLFEETQNYRFGGEEIPVMSTENLLLCLADHHGDKHHWARLFWVLDIVRIIEGDSPIDWSSLLSKARRLGCLRRLLLALDLAARLSSRPLPGPCQSAIAQDRWVTWLSERVISAYEAGSPPDIEKRAVLPTLLYGCVLRERLWERVQFLLYKALAPRGVDILAYPLHPALHWSYWVLRPFLWLLKSISRDVRHD